MSHRSSQDGSGRRCEDATHGQSGMGEREREAANDFCYWRFLPWPIAGMLEDSLGAIGFTFKVSADKRAWRRKESGSKGPGKGDRQGDRKGEGKDHCPRSPWRAAVSVTDRDGHGGVAWCVKQLPLFLCLDNCDKMDSLAPLSIQTHPPYLWGTLRKSSFSRLSAGYLESIAVD